MARSVMNIEQRALLALVRAGLWSKADPEMENVFPLSLESWTKVLQMARQQTVTGLVFRGFEYLPEDSMPPMFIMARLMAYVDRLESANRKMYQTLVTLWKHFEAEGIQSVLQKGQGIAMMYPDPALRECGDVDIYIPDYDGHTDDLKDVCGVAGENMPDGSKAYSLDGVVVEHHTHLLDIVSPFRQKFVKRLLDEKGFETVRVGGEDGVDVLVPAPEVNLLLLSSHILKHALGVGIGLRQVCDYAVACRYYADRVDPDEMTRIYRKAGIARWARVLDGFVGRFLDFARNDKENDLCHSDRAERVEESKNSTNLLEIIMKGGNFGTFTESRENSSRSKVSRKLHTLRSFCGNMRFAMGCAPGEWFWTMARLMGGQLR